MASGSEIPAADGYGIRLQVCFGSLPRPLYVVNFSAIELIAMGRVKAIALGQPLFD